MTPEELLNAKGIEYRGYGSDLVISCLNPEHEDNKPSLRIDKLTGKYNCFSCGFSGTIYDYFNTRKDLLSIKVLEMKAKIRNMTTTQLTKPLGAVSFNREYRGISAETFNTFDAFTYSGPDLELENRVCFPITNANKNIVCFHARSLHSDISPKYINLPRHSTIPIFPPFPKQVNGSIILVEGMFDLLNMYDKGLQNVICGLGLKQSKKRDKEGEEVLETFSTLKIQGVSKIYIMYDGDTPGQLASKKLEEVLRKSYIVERIVLEDNIDPGMLTREQVEGLKKHLYE